MTTLRGQSDTDVYAYQDVEPPARTGRVINDRYEVCGVVGRGGVADVVRAHDRLLNRDVAVKLFRTGSLLGDDLVRIEAESRILAGLSHPHLVAVYDAGVASDAEGWPDPFLVLEHVEGPTLAELIATGPVDIEHAVRLAEQLAGALTCMHERAIVHRDIKPSNILLAQAPDADGTWHAKLTDFGIARVLGSAPMTAQGLTVGTPNYISPEQVRGQSAGPASDVFALGLVLIEVTTGARVYDGTGPEVAFERLHRLPSVPTDVPAPWRDLLRAMTAADPARRPPATEIAKQARALLEPSHPTPTGAAPPVPHTRHRATASIAGVAASRRGRSTRVRTLAGTGVAALVVGATVTGLAVGGSVLNGAGSARRSSAGREYRARPADAEGDVHATGGLPAGSDQHGARSSAPSTAPRPAAATVAAKTTGPTPTGQASGRPKPAKPNGHGQGKGPPKPPDR